ncbi:MAG: hypothetical protein IKN17_13360 [Ruminococcus sp.]|nr:hypothetical protein [Ruminococcus sp.]
MTEEKGFRGLWIPKEIMLDARFTLGEKVLLALICGLDNGEGCYAGNGYLAGICGCTERMVTKTVAKFRRMGIVESSDFDGRRRVLRSDFLQEK